MLAWITYQPRGLPRVRHHIQLLCGLPLCRVEIGGHPSVLLRLLLRREGHALREAGIREGAWAEDLPSWGQMDLRPVDIAPLRRAVLPSLLACAFQQKHLSPGSASVRLTASGTSLPVYWAAQLLGEGCRCQPVEYILPPTLRDSVPPGIEGECLLAALHRQGRLPASELAVKRIHFGA